MGMIGHLLAAVFVSVALVASAAEPGYQSPYTVEFSQRVEELIPDILHGDRAAPAHQSPVPLQEWYSPAVKQKYGAWGPPRAHLAEPQIAHGKSAAWKRERVIATGLRYVGYRYQHHHVPEWDPPADWPWKPVASGVRSKGVDCSNFTTTAYTLALGIKPSSDIHKQSAMTEAPLKDGRMVQAHRIALPESHEAVSKTLRTADLVFIKNDSGQVSHVVLWVGSIGREPDAVPLILDSTGEGRKDSSGTIIPDGVQLRPCSAKSWYYRSASHALRLIPDDATQR